MEEFQPDKLKAMNKETLTKDIIRATALNITNGSNISKSNTEYWDRYNSSFVDRFDYLTKVGEFDLPAVERRIPLQRRLLDLLIAKKTRRPFQYSVYVDSDKSRKSKFDEKIRGYIGYAIEKSERIAREKNMQISTLQQNIGQLTQMMRSSQEQGQEISPADSQKIEAMINELDHYKTMIEKESVLNQDFVNEFGAMSKNNPSAILERVATKYLKYLERVVNFNRMSTYQFRNRVVTGHQNYMVAKFDDQKPLIKELKSDNIFYQVGGPEKYINQKDWAFYREKMSFAQILENFGSELVEEYGRDTLDKLRGTYSPETEESQMWALPNGGVIFGSEFPNDQHNIYSTDRNIDVEWVWFRGSVPVSRRISTDKHGNEHKHIMPSKKLINKDEYTYSRGVYTNKKDPEKKHKKSEVSVYSKNSGDNIETRKYKKLYHSIIIDGEYVINIGEWKNIVRDVDNYNRFNLPIFGKSFDDEIEKPYSLIQATNDIQDLIDIIWVSREYMIAVAGTKGNVIDISQKPDSMTQTEWEYQIKLGRIYIQTMDANGVPKRTSFNQWQSFDNTVSQAITYYDQLITNLTQLMGNIIGIPYQATGETTRSDQVGTNKMAVQESAMITELLFYEHFMIDKEALEEYVSLSIQDANGKDILFTEPNMTSTTEYILDTSKLVDDNIRMNLYSLSEDVEQMRELKALSGQMMDKLGLSFSNILDIWDSETLKEMQARTKYFEEKKVKIAQQAAQADKEGQIQTMKEIKQFETEMAAYLEKVKAQFEQGDLQLRAAKQQFEQDNEKFNQKIELKKVHQDDQRISIDAMKVMEDTTTEKAMLTFDDKHATFDDNLRALELQINTMFESYRLGLDNKKLDIEDRKVKVAAKSSAQKSSKSHTNDN